MSQHIIKISNIYATHAGIAATKPITQSDSPILQEFAPNSASTCCQTDGPATIIEGE